VLNQGLCETSPIFSAFDDVLITIRHQVDALIDWIRALENARDLILLKLLSGEIQV
jgi:hypothetical protein